MAAYTRRTLVIAAALSGLITPARADEASDRALIDDLCSAWQSRQDRVHSFIVEWEEQRMTPKGKGGPGRNGQLPLQDTTHTIVYRLVGDRNRLRLERRGLEYDIDVGDYIETEYIRVFDGRERRVLYNSSKHGQHPGGFLNDGGFFDDGTLFMIQPVTLVFRPLATEVGGIRLADWRVSDRRGSVDGTPCRILERPTESGGLQLLWLADEADHRVLRRQLLARNGVAYEELTLAYENDPEFGAICTSWMYVMRSSRFESINQASSVQEARVRINVPVDDSEFHYRFPAGAVVKYEGTNRRAIALADGTLRPITAGELAAGIPYAELMRTPPPPEAFAHRRTWSWGWVLALAGAAVLVLVAWRWRFAQR